MIPPYGRGEQERHAFRPAAAGPPVGSANHGCDAALSTAPRRSTSVSRCAVVTANGEAAGCNNCGRAALRVGGQVTIPANAMGTRPAAEHHTTWHLPLTCHT